MSGFPSILEALFSSPEIVTILNTHLNPHDLTQCILVSKSFAQIFTPHLWHTISLQHVYQESRFVFSPTTWYILQAVIRNAEHIHIIRVRSLACLEPFIIAMKGAVVMKNVHTLEFPWTTVPLIVSRGLALPGQREGLWPLFELEGFSEHAERETKMRMVEEDRMTKDAERLARQIASDDNSNNDTTSNSSSATTATHPAMTMISGSAMTQNWIRYRAMYPMRREQIMQDLISTRAYNAYGLEWRRYTQKSQQQQHHQQETTLPETNPEWEREDEDEEDMEEKCKQSRIRLQEVVNEIAAFNKEHPLPPFYKHDKELDTEAQKLQKDLREKFSSRHLRLEQDEAASAQAQLKKGGSHARDSEQLLWALRRLGLGLEAALNRDRLAGTTGALRTHYEVKITDFLQRFPTIRTFRDYNSHIEIQNLGGGYGSDGFLPYYMTSMRHLAWSITGGHSRLQRLEGFLRSPYLNLESMRLSLLYPTGMDAMVPRPVDWLYLPYRDGHVPIRHSLSSYLDLDNDTRPAITILEDRTKLMQRAGPIASLTKLFIEDCMCPGILAWGKNYRIPPWVLFLQRCPNLRSLALGSCPPSIWFEIARLLQAHCPAMEDLAIAYGRQLNSQHLDKCDPALSALLFACSHPHMDDTFGQDDETIAEEAIEPAMGLKRLRLDAFVLPLKSHALRMLLDYHSGSLTDLGIMDCKNLQKNFNRGTLLKILRSFSQLEQVHLLPSGEVNYVEEDHVIDAQAVIDSIRIPTQYTSATSTWACATSLKTLRVMIGGLVSTCSHSSSSDMDTTADGELDLQRQVYRFLGSLTNLEELSLGFGPEDDSIFTLPKDQGRQKDCLEFSLDSGLELLEGLKSLRVLNVARMNHRIRMSEVQWMCRSWPQLRVIEGLLKVKSMEQWQASQDDDVTVGWARGGSKKK
ncbi:hypothetical protein BGZ96_008149 [Linnemannia gamsii]|uniref:F-box domain-containing protein n=1 Tax=Linnemannia gamsii TaxID=64522 RepID=A0ABQ7JZX5_9FUNG|nr:hypothetical protein BGZ96_008149 [Linnemannia gamsii]